MGGIKRIWQKCRDRDCHTVLLQLNLFIIVCIVLLVSWLAFVPVKVYEFDAPYNVVKDTYRKGQAVEVRQSYCKLKPYPAVVNISIVDGYVEALRTINTNTPVGCHDRISTSAVIPTYLPDGEYRLRYVIQVKVNAFRTETYTVETKSFEVVE